MIYIISQPIDTIQKFTNDKVKLGIGYTVKLYHNTFLWGIHPKGIRCKIYEPISSDWKKCLVSESKQVIDNISKDDQINKVLNKINNIDKYKIVLREIQRRVYDLGTDYPYLYNNWWILEINKRLNHPSISVDRLKFKSDKKYHLAVSFYTTW